MLFTVTLPSTYLFYLRLNCILFWNFAVLLIEFLRSIWKEGKVFVNFFFSLPYDFSSQTFECRFYFCEQITIYCLTFSLRGKDMIYLYIILLGDLEVIVYTGFSTISFLLLWESFLLIAIFPCRMWGKLFQRQMVINLTWSPQSKVTDV